MGHFDTQRPPPPPTFGLWSVDADNARAALLERGAVTQSAVHSETKERVQLAWVHWPDEASPDEAAAIEALREEIVALPQRSRELSHPRLAPILDTGFADGPYFAIASGPGLPLREVYKGASRGRGVVEYELRSWAKGDESYYRRSDGTTCVGPDHYATTVVEAPVHRRFALRFIADAASALSTLHEAGTCHGGLTLDRLFLKDGGALMVSHFGVERGERGRRLCGTGTAPLSVHGVSYAAPEELLDPASVSPEGDVFALGAILHELLTFTHLFRAKSQSALVEQVLRSEVPAPSRVVLGMPPIIDDIVLQALARDPKMRFRGAGAMQRALALALADEPPCGADELSTLAARAHRAQPGDGSRIAFW